MNRDEIETKEYLDEILSYSPETGELTWKVQRGLYAKGAEIGETAGVVTVDGYIRVTIEYTEFKAHRLAWILNHGQPIPPGVSIDHVNGVPADNRITNLRLCSQKENSRNSKTPKNSTSGFKGVSKVLRSNTYRAYICVDRKQIHLGCFKTPELAYEAYVKAAHFHFGEFARV